MLTAGGNGLQQCILFFKCTHQAEVKTSSRKSSKSNSNECLYALFSQEFFKDASGKLLQEVCNFLSKRHVRILKNCEDIASNRSVEKKHLILIEAVMSMRKIESNSPEIRFAVREDSLNSFKYSSCSIPLYTTEGDTETETFSFKFEEDNLKILEKLLSQGSTFCYGHRNGGTILHFATLKNHIDLVKVLLSSKYRNEIDAPQSDGSTPIYLAVKKGYTNIVQLLLEHGADVHNRAVKFIIECVDLIPPGAGSGPREIIVLDLESEPIVSAENFADSDVEDTMTLLHLAARKGREDVVELLLLHGADINAEVTINYFGRTFTFSPVLIAALSRHHNVVDVLLRLGADINSTYLINNEQRSILHEALVRRDIILTEIISKHKPCVTNKFNQKAFIFALSELYNGTYKELVEVIGRHGFTLSIENVENCNEIELLFGAIHKNQLSIVRYLLERNVSFVDKLWKPGFFDSECTVMHMAAAFSDEGMIEFLLRRGAQVDSLDSDGQTPSFYAVINSNRRGLKYLIENGANITDHPELSFGAVFTDDHIILEMLLLYGVRVNAAFSSAGNVPFLPVNKSDDVTLSKHFSYKHKIGVKDIPTKHELCLINLLVCKGSREEPDRGGGLTTMRGFRESMAQFADVPLIFYAVARCSKKVLDLLLKYGAFSKLNTVNFDRRSLAVAAECFESDFDEMSVFSMFSQVLDYGFPNFDKSRGFENYFRAESSNNYYLNNHAVSYVKYLVKISSCFQLKQTKTKTECEVLYDLLNRLENLGEIFQSKDYATWCEKEIVRLKKEQVGDTDLTLYDILLEDETRIASYTRNPSFASLLSLKNSDFPEKFPIYSLIIISKIHNGFLRKDLMAKGIQLYSFFFEEFSNLPFEMKVQIVNHIPTYDLQVLNTGTSNLLRRCIC